MFDDFFIRALLGGIGTAIIAGPLGCFIVWRRLAYFGDTLSHSALLGVALALLFEINITVAVFITSLVVAFSLFLLQKRRNLSSDTLLGMLAHSSIALGLVVLAFMSWVRVDLLGFLFGDILSITKTDVFLIWFGGIIVLAMLVKIWRPLFAATVSPEIAKAEELAPDYTNILFMIMMALVIAISMKIVGVMLITALLIIPAAAARSFSRSPEQMALLAILFGILAVSFGLFGSLQFDTPAGPSIIVSALLLFIVSILPNLFSSQKKSTEIKNTKIRSR